MFPVCPLKIIDFLKLIAVHKGDFGKNIFEETICWQEVLKNSGVTMPTLASITTNIWWIIRNQWCHFAMMLWGLAPIHIRQCFAVWALVLWFGEESKGAGEQWWFASERISGNGLPKEAQFENQFVLLLYGNFEESYSKSTYIWKRYYTKVFE